MSELLIGLATIAMAIYCGRFVSRVLDAIKTGRILGTTQEHWGKRISRDGDPIDFWVNFGCAVTFVGFALIFAVTGTILVLSYFDLVSLPIRFR